MGKKTLSLKQAEYRTQLAASVFTFILEKSPEECTIELNNLILLARDINQEIQQALLKHAPQPLLLTLLGYVINRPQKTISLDQAMYRAGLAMSLFEVILDKIGRDCSEELRDLLSLACDFNQDVYHALCTAVYGEE
ncbi:hypothetical protein KKJ06_14795 [Xenorhabdus bovienii]|uniref:Uncharacterized protein n=2 Tax=Xenorhabdus TaxID=626 RepID=A0A077PH22_XENBV|nr:MULTISPECIES: hypothetical protein [Xenorhabdus]MDE9455801.1 hypothetical protein [Xenorhabdus bovienii]MDE9543857.1 hypothetical protein [Xenorhabdus bovienii]MDE9553189.1 hypothetical protein [Xenorhabdus bovienii]MDE9556659.1 hypothetical protein [Xenorhabdus bovienii]MDE9565402.1 hypothetical protein [Xenorhabdus bovienii]